jgi:hypothetical protein
MFAISAALAEEPLSIIATIAHTDTDTLLARLGEMGLSTADAGASIQDIAQASGRNSSEILASLLGEQQSSAPSEPEH